MIRKLISLYLPSYPTVIVYMLQSTEYDIPAYLKWLQRTKDFTRVMHRRKLDPTRRARLLLLALRLGISLHVAGSLLLVGLGLTGHLTGGVPFGLALLLLYPLVWPYLLALAVVLARELVAKPKEAKLVAATRTAFAGHGAVRIAVLGSYGKTSMKELLTTVLSEGLRVAATPANKNVSVSHALFARSLQGEEEVLIIEYGEGAPGDIAKFARHTHPTHAIITGLAPAHLDKYKTLKAAGEDLISIGNHVDPAHIYSNFDSRELKRITPDNFRHFDGQEVLGWQVRSVETAIEGTSFVMQKDKVILKLRSGLVGRHQVGFLALVAALAIEFGLTPQQVEAGIAKTRPFEHRMQPYKLSDAWIIDDTYNGNLEGVRAGTELLHELPAKRKIYVTPGLVDQGEESERVHTEMGRLIAAAQPDIVVLMKNSATDHIRSGLTEGNFAGEVKVEADPLAFYTHLSDFVAHGDVVLMQNDWPDNYA